MIRTGKICVSLIANIVKEMKNEDNSFDKKNNYIKCLSRTFSQFGGVLTKVSQILNLNNEGDDVFSNCKPFSKDITHDFFINQILTKEEFKNVHLYIDEVFNSGSIGQVYKCNYKNDNIIIKVQYKGLKKQTKNDLKMLEKIISYLYNVSNVYEIVDSIKQTINDELDYQLELENIKHIRQLFIDDPTIIIPYTYPELSSDNYISMQYLEGKTLSEFILTASEEERNIVGQRLTDFIFKNIYCFNILYSDCHYGNFLISDDLKINIIDFGCIHYIDNELVRKLKLLHISLLHENKENFFQILKELNIINEQVSIKSKEYAYSYFKIQYEPLISDDFEFSEEWLEIASEKDMVLTKEWTLPANMVYFNKIPYGLYHLLTKLKINNTINQNILKYLIE